MIDRVIQYLSLRCYQRMRVIGVFAIVACLFSTSVHAYVGPGAGLTMLGALWGVILALVFIIGGLLIWPIRAYRRRRNNQNQETKGETPEQDTEDS